MIMCVLHIHRVLLAPLATVVLADHPERKLVVDVSTALHAHTHVHVYNVLYISLTH